MPFFRGGNGFILTHSTISLNWYPDLRRFGTVSLACLTVLFLRHSANNCGPTISTAMFTFSAASNQHKGAHRGYGALPSCSTYDTGVVIGYMQKEKIIVRGLSWQVIQGSWGVGNKYISDKSCEHTVHFYPGTCRSSLPSVSHAGRSFWTSFRHLCCQVTRSTAPLSVFRYWCEVQCHLDVSGGPCSLGKILWPLSKNWPESQYI